MSRLVLGSLALLFATAPALIAQRPPAPKSFDELRDRIEREKMLAPSKRTYAINQISRFKMPSARDYLLKFITREAPGIVFDTALRQLKQFYHKRCLAVLADEMNSMANDGRKNTLKAAAWGLSGQGEKGVDALLGALGKKGKRNKNRRIAALYGLRYVGQEPRVFDALAAMVQSARGEEAQEVMRALGGQKKSADLTKIRVGALKHKEAGVRVEALYQLARAEHPGIAKHLKKLAKDKQVKKDRLDRAKLFYVCGRILTPQRLPLFLELGESAGPFCQTQLGYLTRLKKVAPVVHALLVKAAGSKKELERYTAVRLLCLWPGEESLPALRKALADRSARVVRRALRHLVAEQDEDAVKVMGKLMSHGDEKLRIAAMEAAHGLRQKSRRWAKTLLGIVRDGGSTERLVALDLLRDLEHKSALPDAQKLLEDPLWATRSAAVAFLIKVRDVSSVPLLIVQLEQETGRLRFEILGALRGLTGMNYREAGQWRQWWEASAKKFKLPEQDAATAEDASAPRAAVTYYSMPLISKQVCFVLDTSGSMAEKIGTERITKLAAAKRALYGVIENCAEDFAFNLVPFSNDAKALVPQLIEASDANKMKARAFVKKLRAKGGTNVYAALKRAFKNKNVDTIYVLSDGYPSVGEITNIDELADEVREWNRSRRIIIHGISLGTESKLLKRLARESGGTYVKPL